MQPSIESDTSAPVLYSTIPSYRIINNDLGLVKKLIDKQLAASEKTEDIKRLLEHLQSRSGKMIRAGLVLLSGLCCGKITYEHIRIAAVIEMIHNATLLHDDVIDEGYTRRGQPTVNRLWGNESAVLLGDYVLSQVFKLCSEIDTRLSRAIAASAARVCEGELRQVSQKQNWELSEPEYIEIITEKSAVLFSSCCYLGSLLCNADEQTSQLLSDFGLNVGIAFQITDDLFDLTSTEDKTGKTTGCDVRKNKPTLALIHLLKSLDKQEKNTLLNSHLDISSRQHDMEFLVRLMNDHGSLEYARLRAREYVNKALQSLKDIKDSSAKDALIETADFMVCRSS
jgi:octaprenyl-diphosphate synthase